MKARLPAICLVFAVGALAGALGTRGLPAQPAPATVTEVLRADLAGMDGTEVIVQLLDVAPGVRTGKHYHPGHEVAYILEGAGAFEAEGASAAPMGPGAAVYIPPRRAHEGINTSRTDRLKVLVFRIHDKGQPVTVKAE
jgi:quercetin dioxygenase-like cupin family protein